MGVAAIPCCSADLPGHILHGKAGDGVCNPLVLDDGIAICEQAPSIALDSERLPQAGCTSMRAFMDLAHSGTDEHAAKDHAPFRSSSSASAAASTPERSLSRCCQSDILACKAGDGVCSPVLVANELDELSLSQQSPALFIDEESQRRPIGATLLPDVVSSGRHREKQKLLAQQAPLALCATSGEQRADRVLTELEREIPLESSSADSALEKTGQVTRAGSKNSLETTKLAAQRAAAAAGSNNDGELQSTNCDGYNSADQSSDDGRSRLSSGSSPSSQHHGSKTSYEAVWDVPDP